MEEKDFRRIEEMMSRMMSQFRVEIGDDFRHQLDVQREDFQPKLDLVVEGQQMLAERMDRLEGQFVSVEERVQQQSGQITGIASDLKDHRRDTEAHRKGWRVRED